MLLINTIAVFEILIATGNKNNCHRLRFACSFMSWNPQGPQKAFGLGALDEEGWGGGSLC